MKACYHCGDPIDTGEWYPVVAPENGVALLPFCSDDCLDRWERRSDSGDVAGTDGGGAGP